MPNQKLKDKNSDINIAGHKARAGFAILRKLISKRFANILTLSSSELDLRDQACALNLFKINQFEYFILAAAKVGDIVANNTYKHDFLYDNLMTHIIVIKASKKIKLKS
ncbi:NAD-dependent epimerase/dehydratase family protein [Pedobacter mucosus]|uniref:NAD-dependent epimerase/dehydratase family protein n=1 Tax=Pedobacter mucosus TaxID=2895286 RepID=UPI001EE40C63|nr:NAD-dependent epimerase/dehydratase family protein [Pedobacter mucosus]UKT63253.1 NAD-dependent epimerase/dehydratase family protein [Pedobacter mucosus]